MNYSRDLPGIRAISSVVERLLHTQEVAGSNPASRMSFFPLYLGEAHCESLQKTVENVKKRLFTLKFNVYR
jgi:hypothetical protein